LNGDYAELAERFSGVAVGSDLRIVILDGTSVRGRFQSLSQTELIVQRNGQDESIPFDAIREVRVDRSRAKGCGLLGGVLFGLPGALFCGRMASFPNPPSPGAMYDMYFFGGLLFCGLIGMAGGALIGWVMPRWEPVFDRSLDDETAGGP